MKTAKQLIVLSSAIILPSVAMGQAAVDLYNLSRPDLRGTARFMSMAGAFTALGGDMSTLNQNPAGIGIYRSSEVGLTLNLDIQSASTQAQGSKATNDQTKFSFNNFGYVGTTPIDNYTGSTFSWGVTYSRLASFDRMYSGSFGSLNGSSLSNFIAANTNREGSISPSSMLYGDNYNPYTDGSAPWLSILAFQGYVINDNLVNGKTNYSGLMGSGTSGAAGYQVRERGYVDEYSINFGGNLYNTVYWGVGIGISDVNYTQESFYEEDLDNAYIAAQSTSNTDNYDIVPGRGDYRLNNYLNSNGNGFNLKFGLIFKPINEFRLGIAVHTPTWYNMTDTYWGGIGYDYTPTDQASYKSMSDFVDTNDGYDSWYDYKMRTPWRLMVGAAGVIGGQGIVSVDYEYRGNNTMQVSDYDGAVYEDVTSDVKTYYKGTNILRLGAEYRVTPNFSLRAGYSYESSPVKQEAADNDVEIWTAGTIPSYTFDKTTQYITCGIGYRYQGFYTDLAYVHKQRESTYHAYSPLYENGALLQDSPSAKLTSTNNQIVLSVGYKF